MVPTLNNMPTSQDKSKTITNTNTCPFQEFDNILLLYDIYQPVKPNAQDVKAYSIEFLDIDIKNMTTSLL